MPGVDTTTCAHRAVALAVLLLVVALTASAAGAGQLRRAAVPTGTWVGLSGVIGVPEARDRLAAITLKLSGSSASVVATGPTGASHDAPDARAICTSRYRFTAVVGGWRLYSQLPGGTVKGEGGLETGPCASRPAWVMRVRSDGARLKAQWGPKSPAGTADPPSSYLFGASLTRR